MKQISFKHLLAITLAAVLLISAVAIAAEDQKISQEDIEKRTAELAEKSTRTIREMM